MSIILELQQQAIDSNTDILSILRKALLVSRKLELTDFEQWINSELNGYQNTEKIPDYRKIHGELKGWNPVNGWIPVLIEDTDIEEMFCYKRTFDSIPSLCSLMESKEKQLVIPMQGSESALISKCVGFSTKYQLFISSNSVNNIIEQVKNKILDWSLILEERGIKGEGLTFTQAEKATAKSDPNIVQYISNFYGDISDSQIQQGTKRSMQKK